MTKTRDVAAALKNIVAALEDKKTVGVRTSRLQARGSLVDKKIDVRAGVRKMKEGSVSGATASIAGAEDKNAPNSSLICPMTLELMKDPVVNEAGITYERKAIEKWFRAHATDPVTNRPLKSKVLIPNQAVKSMISEYKSECKMRAAAATAAAEVKLSVDVGVSPVLEPVLVATPGSSSASVLSAMAGSSSASVLSALSGLSPAAGANSMVGLLPGGSNSVSGLSPAVVASSASGLSPVVVNATSSLLPAGVSNSASGISPVAVANVASGSSPVAVSNPVYSLHPIADSISSLNPASDVTSPATFSSALTEVRKPTLLSLLEVEKKSEEQQQSAAEIKPTKSPAENIIKIEDTVNKMMLSNIFPIPAAEWVPLFSESMRIDLSTPDKLQALIKKCILGHFGDINDQLLMAILQGEAAKVKTLMTEGADINIKMQRGPHIFLSATPAFLVATIMRALYPEASQQIMQELQRAGADINAPSKQYLTALQYAKASGDEWAAYFIEKHKKPELATTTYIYSFGDQLYNWGTYAYSLFNTNVVKPVADLTESKAVKQEPEPAKPVMS